MFTPVAGGKRQGRVCAINLAGARVSAKLLGFALKIATTPRIIFRSSRADYRPMAPRASFIDGFSCDPTSPGFEVHQKLDLDLRNCDSLWPHAPMGMLFPGCASASAKARQFWVPFVMERVEWNCTCPPLDADKWLLYLTCMLRMLVRGISSLDELTLLRLAKLGPRMHLNRGGAAHFHDLAPLLAKSLARRKIPLSS